MVFWSPSRSRGFHSRLPDTTDSIFYWEALAVVSAIDWASHLTDMRPHRLLVYCDNTNTVDMFNTLHAQPPYNLLLKFAIDRLIHTGIDLHVVHLAGIDNGVADALSHFQEPCASALHPGLRTSTFLPPRDAMGASEL
ncbi:hypothetical protein EWM64_g9158 [Hericium alpestre]|uniref:RNase H type-1 domain-containing protein n=1 Tax=Hericium alpestre TaxID=135208 RepID=A0A4Y9ZK73_9AGAM|nr:hypothetical protein EWM64_g9158 [Hericium alpestre]